jgi:hypothetical protein
LEYWVVDPTVGMFKPVWKVTLPELSSIRWAVIVGAEPAKLAAGKNRKKCPDGMTVADDLAVTPAKLVQPEVPLAEYCHWPWAASTVYSAIAIPANEFAEDPPVTVSAVSLKFPLNRD